jgi:hypothetical protein
VNCTDAEGLEDEEDVGEQTPRRRRGAPPVRVTSAAAAGVLQRSRNAWRARIARYSGM